MEIGSFLELQLPKGREWYKGDKDIASLNTGRMGIWHAFRVTGCKRIWIPIYQCDSIRETFEKKGVEICFYHQDKNFDPIDIKAKDDDAVLVVNYYGIMSSERMAELAKPYKHAIVDCAQAFFCKPVEGALTVYSCRKFVGTPDGCYVVGKDAHKYVDEYPQCFSSDTAAFLLMRIEYGCEGKGYEARGLNEHRIDAEDCMKMSKLTRTLMDAEDYAHNQQKRKENFAYAHQLLGGINKIDPTRYMDGETIPMVYPLVVEDDELIKRLFAAKHFQGHWWSYICDEQPVDSFEHWISRYVIPITIDQRYGKEELDYLANIIKQKYMNNSYNGHLCIVFALEHYNPLNMIRAFGENGINPVYISVKRRYEVATRSKYISKLHRVDSVEEGFDLLMKEYGNLTAETGKKPYIVFSDDKSVGYFDLHYDEWKDKFITYNAGRNGRINEFMDKYQIQQLAKKHGFNVLDSYVIGKNDPLPENLWYPIITKDISPNSGSWKFDVYICQNEKELKEAIQKIESPLIMIQHFVDKQNEMALEGYTINHGKEMQIITQMKWKYLIQGYYSPYHDVCMFTDKEMEKKLQAMFEEIGFEGVFEVEFLIDKDGTIYFMETNFRASAWNPTCKFAGMPLDYLWVKGMENGYIDPADRKEFEPFTSMSEVIDYGKRVEGGMVSLAEWLRDFKDAKCVYIYDKEDRGPWDAVIENWDSFK